MKTVRLAVFALSLASIASIARSNAQPTREAEQTLYDEEFRLASFADMDYPLDARRANVQGVVVVWATLDDDGRVASASAISGPRLLIPHVLANAKKWLFHPNDRKSAVIVYDFRIDQGVCHDALNSLFLLVHYNFATITSCQGVTQG
jgi:outer membrane biosynthesis protein TonB